MRKELKDLLQNINEKKQQIRDLVTSNELDKAEQEKGNLIDMQKQFDLLFDLEEEKTKKIENAVKEGVSGLKVVGEKADSIKNFANAARSGFQAKMEEGTLSEGGYTVPEDIQTKVESYRESKASLIDLVRVEAVKTEKGARTFKKRSQQTGFVKVGEGGKISGKSTPQFERISYEISKYAGYFPVTNELLEDSDHNIVQTLVEWIGNESRVTRNKLILDAIGTKAKLPLKDLDSIKDVINVTLGAAFRNTSVLVTNDDGFNYLDKLKDADGKYILQPSVLDTTQYRLFGLPLKVYPNADLPSDITVKGKRGIPFIMGDLKEGIVFFDRKQMNIKASDIAAVSDLNAFEEDLTLWRAIEREDVKVRDEQAFVYGEMILNDSSVAGDSAS